MREGPLDAAYHRGDPTASPAADDAHVDDVGLRRDADELTIGASPVTGDDAGDVRAVPARVACRRLIRKVDRGDDTIRGHGQIRVRRDARIEHRDRDAVAADTLRPDLGGLDDPLVFG